MRRSDSLYSNVNKFAVAAFVVIATVLGLLHPAQAQIVYTPANVTIYQNTYNLDVNNDGVTDFAIHSGGGKFCNCRNGGCQFLYSLNEFPTSGNGVVGSPPAPLLLGHAIGPKQVFYGGTGQLAFHARSCSGQFTNAGRWISRNGKTAYLGFRFQINGETHYGWAKLTVSGIEATLTGYAYEATPGQALTAGQTQ